MISDGENNLIHNKCNKRLNCRNAGPNHKNTNIGSSAIEQGTEIYLHIVDMIDKQIQQLL